MRQTDFTIGKTVARYRSQQRRALILQALDAPVWYTIRALRKARRTRKDIHKIKIRSISISINTFNINIYSDEWAVRDFRFQVKDISKISGAMGWFAGKTQRNGFKCPPLTACCIVLRKLSSPCRWKDVEYLFGMHSSALSEIFWEVIESFVQVQGHLITDLRQGLLVSRAELYADCIKAAGAPLDSCVGFMDCTKIKMTRPGGHGSIQRSCYSGHKRMHCLIYQTITTPDGLIFSLYGPEVGRRYDVTLLRESGIEEGLQSCLLINGRQLFVCRRRLHVTAMDADCIPSHRRHSRRRGI